MNKEIELLKRKIMREGAARIEAEQLLEEKSLELYRSNEKLKDLNSNLESLVEQRTNALTETELEYSTMVESINDMIFRLDMQGNIVFTNQIVYNIIGASNESLEGRHILDFISEENRKQIFIYFARQYLQRNCINYYEVSLTSKFNKKIWVRLNVQFSSSKCKLCVRKQQALANTCSEVKASSDCNFNEIIIVAHDITQQKVGQDRLEKSEKRYRELTESLPEMICEIDTKGNLLYVNNYAIDKFGYTSDEVLNGHFGIYNIFPEELHGQVNENLAGILQHGNSTSTEYLAQKKSGERFPVIVYTSPIIDLNTIIGVRGVMVDISERKKNELEIKYNLRQQEILSKISMNYNSLEKFEKKTNEALTIIGEHIQVSRVYIFENNADGQFTSNTFEWCNTAVSARIEELKDIPYALIPSWKLILERDGIVCSENINELPQDIVKFLDPQGIRSVIALPLLHDDGVFGFIGFDECISNRKWRKSEIELLRTVSHIISNSFLRQGVQNELIESERQNRIIINSIPDVIIHADSLGMIKSLKSAQGSNLSNLIKSEKSDTIFTAFNDKLAQSLHSAIGKCLKQSEYLFEFKNLNWDEVEYYEARLVKLNNKEVLVIVRDVTVIKQNEKQLEIAKNKAEEASRVKSEFLANVSHEIRTPLNVILGFSQWLFEDTDSSVHKGYLTSIINSGRKLLDVINDILDLSKIESGMMDIEMNPMSYNEIVSDVRLVFQKELADKELNFKITTEASVPDYIVMDELRFYQILFNLVSNAIKFTDIGFIHILARATETRIKDEVDLVISIEDTGIGIDEGKQKQIFESFTQHDGRSTRSYEGTGLGLAIVDGLLKKMNGSIKVNSVVGKGTTFTLTFNNVKISKSDHIAMRVDEYQDSKMKLGPCTIMIVDDIAFNIEVLKALINSDEVKYIEAVDGTDALAKLAVITPDIIFMDIRMPGLDGYDVTKIIKADEKLKHIPVIAFSASTIKSRSDFIERLFDDFLQKPVFKKDVEDMLMKFLPKHYERILEQSDLDELHPTEEIITGFEEQLPELISDLEGKFMKKWVEIKGSLVIYEIEDFKNQLSNMASEKTCPPISLYCSELDMGLQSFDIELIEKKMIEFPELIEKLKKMIV